jgi:hypothetical protein
MIESCYWKEELERVSCSLRPRRKPARWTERAHCVLEREIMIGFFIIRRMIELHKVSSATRSMTLRVFSFPARGKRVTQMNGHHIEELYDLAKERHETKKPFYMSNQFIHCYTIHTTALPFFDRFADVQRLCRSLVLGEAPWFFIGPTIEFLLCFSDQKTTDDAVHSFFHAKPELLPEFRHHLKEFSKHGLPDRSQSGFAQDLAFATVAYALNPPTA